jgi:hypothetical protein
MTKLQNNLTQVNNILLPYGKYCIDSFKLLIDKEHFKAINIPENFIEISADTGEQIREFKRKSIQIPFNNTTIYLGAFRKVLRSKSIDKLAILFSSKVAGNDYFHGITKPYVLDVIQHIKDAGYIDFDNIETIYKNLYSKDVDVKVDFKFSSGDREKINSYNKELEHRFVFPKEHIFRFGGKDGYSERGLGIETFKRDRSTLARPFLKFYDKTTEIRAKHNDFLLSLPDDIKKEISESLIYRYEYTLRDKEFMAKFGVINRLEDVLEVAQDKWREIGKTLLNANFQAKMINKRDLGKLTPTEKVLALMFFELFQKHNVSLAEIQTMFTSVQESKKSKYRAKILFEKIYGKVSLDNAREVEELSERYKNIREMDMLFGLWSEKLLR